MAASKTWVVTLADESASPEVTQLLTKTGFRIQQVLSEVGCITGEASDEVAAQVRGLPGVAAVEQEPSIQLPPPDAPITW